MNIPRHSYKLVALFSFFIFSAASLLAQSFDITPGSFSNANVCANMISPPPACMVLTNGAPNNPTVLGSGILRLNAANQNQHASAWYVSAQPLNTGFTTSFQFQISRTGACQGCSFPGDGLALVIQNDPLGTGALGYDGNGQNISYGNADIASALGFGQAIQNSLAVELDTFQNSEYGDPDGNHIAVQGCTPNNATTLSDNSADHTYLCPDGSAAKLALQSLPVGVSLSDGAVHTITVNYTPPGSCTMNCNNFAVYLDSNLVLQATLDITQQLFLNPNGGAFIGLTSSTGASVENNDIVSWSFSQLPLSPITIDQPLQPTTTNFNFTQTLSEDVDYSQSGLPGSAFQGVVMQGTTQSISPTDFANLVANTPFQGSTCLLQDTGNQSYQCVVTTDLCTTPSNSNPSGANCPNTGTNALIQPSNTFNLDPAQKPIVSPAYVMGKDTALSCPIGSDNSCKGLINIFSSISGDAVKVNGKTDGFNSILIPIEGNEQPVTTPSSSPVLNNGWINTSVNLTLNSTEVVPPNNTSPPSSPPTITGINYSATGANPPIPASGILSGATGSITIPAAVEGSTTITFFATDNAGNTETIVTNSGNQVSSAPPTFTIKVDLTPPMASCMPTNLPSGWTNTDVTYNCTASDGGSGLANPSQSNFGLSTSVPSNTQTSNATIPAVNIYDVAGNFTTVGPYGPFEVDKLAPTISGLQLLTNSPTLGQNDTASYTCSDIGGSGVTMCGPTGSGTFPAVPSVNEVTTLDTTTLGSHMFTVNSQDAVNNVSTPVSVNYVVGQATTTTAILSNTPNPSNIGQVVIVSFSVTGSTNIVTPTGTVLVSASSGESCSAAVSMGSCSITFNTGGSRTLTAKYSGDTNFVGSTSTPVNQSVNGALLSISPTSLNFSNVFLYLPAAQVVTVTNTGSANVMFSGISITGASDDDFWLISLCGSTLKSGKSCQIFVNFYADEIGAQSANLSIADNAPNSPQLVPLAATVINPGLTLNPSYLNFGSVKLGTPVTQNIAVTSSGTTALNISNISINGGYGDFTQTNNCPASLNPGSGCVISVTFKPSAKTSRSATVTVTDNAFINRQSVPLSGKGN